MTSIKILLKKLIKTETETKKKRKEEKEKKEKEKIPYFSLS